MSARRLSGLAVVAAMTPLVLRSVTWRVDAVHALALLLGAMALNGVVGWAGQPSLGHGALLGVGGYTYAVLRGHSHVGPVLAVAGAVAVVTFVGLVVGRAVADLRGPFAALVTWMLAWAFWIALGAFPGLTGGSAGAVVPGAEVDARALGVSLRIGSAVQFELALAAVLLAALATTSLLRRYGPALALQRDDPVAARAAGIDIVRFRWATFALSSAVAGAAGILLVQAAGVADPTTFRPLLSVELFLVVLVGGAGEALGPFLGLLSLGVITALAHRVGPWFGVHGAEAEPVGVAVLLALVLLSGGGGVASRVRSRTWHAEDWVEDSSDAARRVSTSGASLQVQQVSVSFGHVQALDSVTLEVAAGECQALIGPNGSGKTTMLRVIAGGVECDRGAVLLDGEVLEGPPHRRARSGVARMLQQMGPSSSPTDAVVAGIEPTRRTGFVQALLATPLAQAEQASASARARAALGDVGADASQDFAARRLRQLARALVAQPRVLLLDEPSAGLDEPSTSAVAAVLRRTKEQGMTLVLVTHDIRLVRAIADRVTVLHAGRVIATGVPDEVLADPAVTSAYLGG